MKKQLEIGYNYPIIMREEQLFCNELESFSVMYLSDFHFNTFNGNLVLKIIQMINHYKPTILLLGGDYVDTKGGFKHFTRLLYAISEHKNAFAVAGNHDYFYGIEAIKESMLHNNIHWIEKSTITILIENKRIQIDGNIILNKKELNDFKILCLHKPLNINSMKVDYNLVLAGHLHGGQWVLWENEKGLYPGRLFYRWNILREKKGDCHYYISRGISDALPIRYNCSREAVLVQIEGKDYSYKT